MKKILILLTGLLLLTSCKQQGIQQDEINKFCNSNVISNKQLADLLYSKGIKGVQFIDIRTPNEYAVSHLPGAINVPMKRFFDKAYFSKINKDDVLILYGKDASTPKLMALLAGHFKKDNFNVALGGYEYIQSKIMNNFGIYSGLYDDEKPLVDFQKASDEIRSRSGASATSKPKNKNKPILKRKKKIVGGGCG